MKNNLIYILIIALAIIVYQFLSPRTIVQKVTEYKQGDTVKTVKYDSLYLTKTVESRITDTVYIHADSTVSIPKTAFEIDADTAKVKGKVSFNKDRFSFSDIKFWFPVTEILRIDTIKQTVNTKQELKFYEDTWFYSFIITAALFILTLLRY